MAVFSPSLLKNHLRNAQSLAVQQSILDESVLSRMLASFRVTALVQIRQATSELKTRRDVMLALGRMLPNRGSGSAAIVASDVINELRVTINKSMLDTRVDQVVVIGPVLEARLLEAKSMLPSGLRPMVPSHEPLVEKLRGQGIQEVHFWDLWQRILAT